MKRVPTFVPALRKPRTRPSSAVEAVSNLDDLARLLSSDSGVRLLSLDVFDTLITRACGHPGDIYLWLGRRLSARVDLSVSPEVFARARARAEAVVWDREGGMDSTLGLVDIYREVVDRLALDMMTAEQLATSELELEQEISRPVRAAQALLTQVVAKQQLEIVLASDTYLSGEEVRALLAIHSLATHDRLLVSSDVAASKATGRMFEVMLGEMRHPPDAVVHCGDNPHSDVDVPRSLGLRAAWIPGARLNRFEDQLSDAAWTTGGLSAALAGASRLTRLAIHTRDEHDAAIRDVAAGVAAPVLIGYVLWTLQRARALGLRRLAFLARDGQIMAEIAGRLVSRLGLDVSVDYTPVSRQSTNLAATFELSREETDWVFRDAAGMTVAQILASFDLDYDAIADTVRHIAGDPDAFLDASQISRVRELIESGELRELVLERAAARRRMAIEFLRGRGLVGDSPCGVVDFGGVGSQVRALHDLVTHAGGRAPMVFLMGLDDPAQAGVTIPEREPDWLRRTETWLYDHRRRRGIKRPRGFGTCVQMFCAADHGTVLGYEEVDGTVVPELAVERNEPVIDWGLRLLQDSVGRVVDELVLDDELLDLNADLRGVATRLVTTLWDDPTRAEAAAWGAFPFEGAQATGGRPHALAHAYTVGEVVAGMADGTFPDLGWQHWHEGSSRLSPAPLRTGLRLAERVFERLRSTNNPIATRLVDWARERRP